MSKSAMERLRSGERIEVPLTSGGSASSADVAEVQAIHEALSAWLRVQRGKS